MTQSAFEVASPSVRFGRLERRGVLLGLSGAQLAVVGVGLATAVAAVYSAGFAGLLAATPVWLTLLGIGTGSVAGRALVAWIPLIGQWIGRRICGRTSAVASTRAAARTDRHLTLPGVGLRLELVHCAALGGATLLVDRRAGTLTAVLRVGGAGFVLEDAATQGSRVVGWGRVLAGLCQQPAIVRVQLLSRAIPGGLAPARAWWREHCATPSTPLLAHLASLLDTGFVEPLTRETLLAVAVRSPRRAHLDLGDVAAIARHLHGVADAVSGADLVPEGWLDAAELKVRIRTGYDPFAGPTVESVGPGTPAGPLGVDERWGLMRCDNAVHATYWVSEWPRSEVDPAFLQPILLGAARVRTMTVIAEPIPIAKALREIRRSKAEYAANSAQRARIGQIEAEATRAEHVDLERREAELVAGHGDLRYTGLITVSAPDEAALSEQCAALATAAAQAMCDLRLLVGQQGQAHLAAMLPLARGVL
ncbi:SCO6880 family protein [Cellulomonas sp. URHD0024]|uniref:SCO6880 family protein n=1 Tax=Cellulomonas sp. URHD0024 TaxID=1302620 RepID=UPI0012DF80FB|nr:SCO6880 family protein [Cellulomonas sp. URHD0024]